MTELVIIPSEKEGITMISRAIQLGSRQWELIILIAQLGPVTLAKLTDKTALARTSLRQQVDRLLAEGWLSREHQQGHMGRPADLFSITDQSRQLLAQQTDDFALALMYEIQSQDGESKLRSLINGVGRQIRQKLSPLIGDGTPAERVTRLSNWFADRGALNDLTETENGMRLTVHTCPFHGLVNDQRLICEMECEVLSQLVGAETKLKSCMPNGDQRCVLEVNFKKQVAKATK